MGDFRKKREGRSFLPKTGASPSKQESWKYDKDYTNEDVKVRQLSSDDLTEATIDHLYTDREQIWLIDFLSAMKTAMTVP